MGGGGAAEHEALGESSSLLASQEQQKKQALLDMIDHGLQEYRASTNMYDEMSIDDARSMVESLQEREESKAVTEDDEILI